MDQSQQNHAPRPNPSPEQPADVQTGIDASPLPDRPLAAIALLALSRLGSPTESNGGIVVDKSLYPGFSFSYSAEAPDRISVKRGRFVSPAALSGNADEALLNVLTAINKINSVTVGG